MVDHPSLVGMTNAITSSPGEMTGNILLPPSAQPPPSPAIGASSTSSASWSKHTTAAAESESHSTALNTTLHDSTMTTTTASKQVPVEGRRSRVPSRSGTGSTDVNTWNGSCTPQRVVQAPMSFVAGFKSPTTPAVTSSHDTGTNGLITTTATPTAVNPSSAATAALGGGRSANMSPLPRIRTGTLEPRSRPSSPFRPRQPSHMISGSDTDGAGGHHTSEEQYHRRDSLSTPFLSPDASSAGKSSANEDIRPSRVGTSGYFNQFAWSPVTPSERDELEPRMGTFSDLDEVDGHPREGPPSSHPISLLTALLHEKGMIKDSASSRGGWVSPLASSSGPPSSAAASRNASRKPSHSEEGVLQRQPIMVRPSASAASGAGGRISFAPEPTPLSRSRSGSMSDRGGAGTNQVVLGDEAIVSSSGLEERIRSTSSPPHSVHPTTVLEGSRVPRAPTPILLKRGPITPVSSAPSSRRPSEVQPPARAILLVKPTTSTASSPEHGGVSVGQSAVASSSQQPPATSQSQPQRPRTSCLTFAVACAPEPSSAVVSETPARSSFFGCRQSSPPTSPHVGGNDRDRSRRNSATSISGDQKIGRLGLGVGLGVGTKTKTSDLDIEEEQEDEEDEEDEEDDEDDQEGDDDDDDRPIEDDEEASFREDGLIVLRSRSPNGSTHSQVIRDVDGDDDGEDDGDAGAAEEEEEDENDSEERGASGYEEDSEPSETEDQFVKESQIVSPAGGRLDKPGFGRPCWSRGSPRDTNQVGPRPHFSPSALLRSTRHSLFPRSPRPDVPLDDAVADSTPSFPFARPTNYRRRHRPSSVTSNPGDGHIIGGSATSLVGSFVRIESADRRNAKVHRGRGMVQIVDPVSDHNPKSSTLKESCSRHCSPPPTSSALSGRRSRSPSASGRTAKRSILQAIAAPKAGSSPSAGRLKMKREHNQAGGRHRFKGRTVKGSPMPTRMVMTDPDYLELEADSTSDAAQVLMEEPATSGRSRLQWRSDDNMVMPSGRRQSTPQVLGGLASTPLQVRTNSNAGHVVDGVLTALRRASVTVNPFRRPSSVDVQAGLDGAATPSTIPLRSNSMAVCAPLVDATPAVGCSAISATSVTPVARKLHDALSVNTETHCGA